MKRFLWILTVFIMITVFSFSNGKSGDMVRSTDAGGAAITFPLKEQETLSYFMAFNPNYHNIMTEMGDNYVQQIIQERTNVKIDWIHPPAGQEQEQFNLMIASDELSDIMEAYSGSTLFFPGGPDLAIEDGYYLRLNDYLEEYGPDYLERINLNEFTIKDSRTDQGNIWAFYMVEENAQEAFTGPVIRLDWLNDLGLVVPKTIEETYDVLKAFEENYGAKMWISRKSGFFNDSMIVGSFQANQNFINKNGVVAYGPIEPGFKDYVQTMAKWFSEGLIDPDFVTGDGSLKNTKIANGDLGYWQGGFWEFTKQENENIDQNAVIVGAPYPTYKGQKSHARQTNRNIRTQGAAAVSAMSDNPSLAVAWLNYFYKPENYNLVNYGADKPGDTYNIVDNKIVFSDKIENNVEGVAPNLAMAKYCIHHGPMPRDWAREMYLYSEEANAATFRWDDSAYDDWVMPPITLTASEGNEYSSIMSDIKTYVEEMLVRFIVGDIPLSSYDNYLETIESMNVKRAIEIQQVALDRYIAR
jgi:putative aldouronate transport system substrate-binding protein